MKWISSALQPGWQPTDLVAIPTAAGRQCHGQLKETPSVLSACWKELPHAQRGRPRWA